MPSFKSRFLNSLFCYWTLGAVIEFVKLLPLSLSLRVTSFLARVIPYIVPKDVQVATEQIKFACAKSEIPSSSRISKLSNDAEMGRFISDMFANTGRTVVESLCADSLLEKSLGKNPKYGISCQEDSDVVNILNEKKPLIVLCSHLGCFELLAAYYAIYRKVNLTVMARKPNYKSIDKFIRLNRASNNFETLWREDKNSTSGLLGAIKNKKVIAALIDQDINLENEFVPFFGHPAAYPVGLVKLAVRFSLPIASAFIIRTGSHYHISVNLINYCPDCKDVYKQVLTEYSVRLESLIKQYPDQWVWWHKRWRREPGINYVKNPERLKSRVEYVKWLKSTRG